MRGLKRKFGGQSSENDDGRIDYKENLSQFQTLARQRESMRLKNHCLQLPNSTPGFWEKHLNEKLHVETQMIKGTAKFLAACKNDEQVGNNVDLQQICENVQRLFLTNTIPSSPLRGLYKIDKKLNYLQNVYKHFQKPSVILISFQVDCKIQITLYLDKLKRSCVQCI